MGIQWNIEAEAGRTEMLRLRNSIRRQLETLGAESLDDAELMAWELVTNARRHAKGPMAILVTRYGDRIRVEVFDGSAAHAIHRDFDPERIGGHGVELVDSLSVDWGEEPLGHGKTVWFDTACTSTEVEGDNADLNR